mgnify:CR=1 FL=1
MDYVEAAQNTISVKMIPRIDYNKPRGFNTGQRVQKARNQRAPQKLFNEDNIRAIGGDINHDGDFLIFEGARYSRKVGRRFFSKGPNFCTKFDPLNYFLYGKLYIILKSMNVKICEHSIFIIY